MSQPLFDRSHTDDLIDFVSAAPSPYHAVAETARRLREAGFVEVFETDPWDAEPGGRFTIRAGSVVAWHVAPDLPSAAGFQVFGAHTDSPNLRVKPKPDVDAAGWKQLAVEIYGGVPRDTWLDRDLGLSGRLICVDGSEHLVKIDEPLLRVPRVAIHLDRSVNDGQVLDPQDHLTPVWGLGEAEDGELIGFLARRIGLDPERVAGWDLMTHVIAPPAYLGVERELLSCPRLDNLVSVHAGVEALVSAVRSGDGRRIPMLAAFDHEETGSNTRSGAGGPFLDTVMRRVLQARGDGDVDSTARAFAASVVLSSDTTHAVHPNYADRHDSGHRPAPGGGPTLKINANQRYASDGAGQAEFASWCEKAGVERQYFVSKNSMPCGTTIGPITATRLGVATVDVGIPILSMHASSELCAVDDPPYLAALAQAFLRS